MENLNIIKPKSVQGIINKFCFTIGMIPSSYKLSLTYEEQILAIGQYLEETVYPAINNNAEALAELQGLFTDLKNYVENYFNNLDVQEEINNKLDIMVTDGTLENIINEEIFGNINNSINELNTEIDELNTEINNTNKKYERNALYIGNSYTQGIGSTSGNDGLFELTKDLFDNAYKKIGSGTGFLPYTDHENDTFNVLLNNAINDNTIDNNSITDIIVIGAWRR